MTAVRSVDFCCYARWTFSAVNYSVCSGVPMLRGGVWHQNVMRAPIPLGQAFNVNGIAQGSRYTLDLIDTPGGIYKTLLQNNVLDGTAVTVEHVTTITYIDGTTAEKSRTQALTVVGTSLTPAGAQLALIDLEDEALNQLYPPAVWSTDEFAQLNQDDAGKPIAHPVGTALKIPCPLLRADALTGEWWYGVMEAPVLYTIIDAINTGTKTITVNGVDLTSYLLAGMPIYMSGNTANEGRYTVASSAFSAGNTNIVVNETIPSIYTGDENLAIPPQVLAVYRDGRLVATTEYTVELTESVSNVADPDFNNSGVWAINLFGTGTASVASSHLNMNGDGGATNYSTCNDAGPSPTYKGMYAIRKATTTAKPVFVGQSDAATSLVKLPADKASTFFLKTNSTAVSRKVTFSNKSTGASGALTVDTLGVVQRQLLLLRFTSEQVDFSGNNYTIETDVYNAIESRNAVTEIGRLLQQAGRTIDASSFSTATTYATSNAMLVDCDHGRTEQRRIRAILEDLLLIARATLFRNSTGAYQIVQDKTGASAATYEEAVGDALQVLKVDRPERPKSVSIRYRPGPQDPDKLMHTIKRTVTGGIIADKSPLDVRYLRDHTAADRLLCYLALRAEYNRKLSGKLLLATLDIGSVLTLSSSPTYAGSQDWIAWTSTVQPVGVTFDALEYAAAVHTYTAAPSLPPDAETTYQPDYSKTPPLAPTALKITAGTTDVANDATITARVTVECVPPAVNWKEIWFTAIHNVTSEIGALVRASDIGAGKQGATLTGLRPGEVYQLKAQAFNAFNVAGVVQGTFDDTAIGGGATDTTFTTPGYAVLPANVSSCSASQRMGRMIDVSWPAVSSTVLKEYSLERSVNGGSYAVAWTGRATNYRDPAVSIGSSYQYRVKAVDTYGNSSASYATSGSVTPSSNVIGGASGGTSDLAANTVDPANRTVVSTISSGFNLNGIRSQSQSLSHSLGKIPLATLGSASNTHIIGHLSAVSTSNITMQHNYVGATGATTGNNNSAGDPHNHNEPVGNAFDTGTANVYIW